MEKYTTFLITIRSNYQITFLVNQPNVQLFFKFLYFLKKKYRTSDICFDTPMNFILLISCVVASLLQRSLCFSNLKRMSKNIFISPQRFTVTRYDKVGGEAITTAAEYRNDVRNVAIIAHVDHGRSNFS